MSSCLLAFEHHIKPFLIGSYLICIINCICLLILYLVIDILFKRPSWVGGISFINSTTFLSPPYNSTIQLKYELCILFEFASISCGLGWIQFFSTCSHLGIMLFSHYWYMRATWPPLHALWVEPFFLASIWIIMDLCSCGNIFGTSNHLVEHTH